MYDVIIIGGGVVGTAIARELSKYSLKLLLLEKHSDLCEGTTKANSAIIHGGYDAKPGTLKARLNVRGNALVRELAPKLQFHFKQIGSLVIAFSDEEMQIINELYVRGIKNKVDGIEIWNKQKLLNEEPNLSTKVCGALYCSTAGIVCPFGMTFAFMENAIDNGAKLIRNAEVTDIKKTDSGFELTTANGVFKSNYVINSAGLYADVISKMVGDSNFKILPRKGEYRVFDNNCDGTVKHIIFQTPTKMGKGILVLPTYDGNLLTGPTAEDLNDCEDVSTTLSGINRIDEFAVKSIPSLDVKQTIRTFAGVRARPDTGDFMIYPSEVADGFINVGGIESPGLSSAPAIGEYVAELLNDLLKQKGKALEKKSHFIETRKGIPQFARLTKEQQAQLISQNPKYGNIICRCETVTEAEIIEAIHRPAGARTVDGIKRRVRPGSGRCQGSFCAPHVLEILSRELNLPIEKIQKSVDGTEIILRRLK